jgi:uncharacterized coiled-coil protein SlyX
MTTDTPSPARMLADIERAFAASITPDDLRDRFTAFVRDEKQHVDRLCATLLAAVSWWIVKGREAGHDADVLDQIALQQMQAAIANVCRAMKARQGQPFEPARIAIVAYTIAESVGASPEPPQPDAIERIAETIDDLASDVERERDRLRELIEEIADMDVGDIELEHREIIARCRAEAKRWEDE